MAKLTRKEKEKIAMQMTTIRRGDTWTGIRPTVFKSKKNDKKLRRAESRKLCAAYC